MVIHKPTAATADLEPGSSRIASRFARQSTKLVILCAMHEMSHLRFLFPLTVIKSLKTELLGAETLKCNRHRCDLHSLRCCRCPDEQWWDRKLLSSLPLPLDLLTKRSLFVAPLTPTSHAAVDLYCDFYRPSEMTVMADHFQQNITSTLKVSSAVTSVNPSPFCPRLSASKLQQHQQKEEEERRLSVSSISGSSRNGSEERSKSKRSASNSCNSSSDESSSANDDPGIWPPLDTPISWLYEAQAFEDLKTVPRHNSGYTCSQAFLSQITRPFPVPGFSVKFARPRSYFGHKNEEKKKADDVQDCRDRELALLLKKVDSRQKAVYAEEQSFHLKRQFDSTSEKCDDEPVDCFMESKNLVKRMFPSCEVTYGRIYKELSKGELALFKRYARMAERCGPSVDFLMGSCELSLGVGSGNTSGGGSSSGGTCGAASVCGGTCEEGSSCGEVQCSSSEAGEEVIGCPQWFAQLKDPSSHFWTDPESSLPKFAEPLRLVQESTFTQDSYLEVGEPTVDRESKDLYKHSVDMTECGPSEPSPQDLQIYIDSAALSF
ncbi:hypothetical protein FHG87_005286 [Trinorchestia longiramus]|nr:hypothetical protein FHG87_005286 [Trinorchestia longiramus]